MEIKEYTPEIEDLFVRFFFSDPSLYVRCKTIVRPDYFESSKAKSIVECLLSHTDKYNSLPTAEQVKAITGFDVTRIENIKPSDIEWFLTEIEKFIRYKALCIEILKSPDLIEKRNYAAVETNIKKAISIALVKDLGTDYFSDPKARLELVKDRSNKESTGLKAIDEKLYGGVNRGEITIFAGQCVVASTLVKAFYIPSMQEIKNVRFCKKPSYTEADVAFVKQYFSPAEFSEIQSKSRWLNYVLSKIKPHEHYIVDIDVKDKKWFVFSPDGYVPVLDNIKKAKEPILKVKFTDGTTVDTSPFHMFQTTGEAWVSTVNLQVGMEIKGVVSKVVESVVETGTEDYIYDLVIDHDNHRYYTNGVCSHNSGAGKSLFLQNISVNWVRAGLNVLYVSLELSESLCSMRLDSIVTGVDTKSVIKSIDDVDTKVRMFSKKHKGSLRIKQLPSGLTTNGLRAYMKEFEVQTGIPLDAVVVDYLDLMYPNDSRVNPSDHFIKDKYVTEELRNLASEANVLMLTASQLNRSSHQDAIEFNHAHIAGGISKVNTADNVIAIFTTPTMKENGRYQLQFLKTRSSAGVGSKVELKFNPATLLISDLEPGEEASTGVQTASIVESLRRSSSIPKSSNLPFEQSVKEATSKLKPAEPEVADKVRGLRDLLRKIDK